MGSRAPRDSSLRQHLCTLPYHPSSTVDLVCGGSHACLTSSSLFRCRISFRLRRTEATAVSDCHLNCVNGAYVRKRRAQERARQSPRRCPLFAESAPCCMYCARQLSHECIPLKINNDTDTLEVHPRPQQTSSERICFENVAQVPMKSIAVHIKRLMSRFA